GVVSVASHLVGEQIQQMIQAFEEGNTMSATTANLQLFPLFKVLFCMTNPMPIKAALNLQGWKVGGLRPPLVELLPDLKKNVETVLKELSLIQ
ncbi:MAG: dihydrodipicolinate synthase family protein, partial [Microcystaceae cyanobacterium]